MTIALIGFNKILYMPYINFYLSGIDVCANEVHVIYWIRDNNPDIDLPKQITLHGFRRCIKDTVPLIKKSKDIISFGRFAKKELKRINPDLLIVMHSTTAISFYRFLKNKYKGRYIFDYRDITYENICFYKKMVNQIIINSKLSFTSSDGFRFLLPDSAKLMTSHNVNFSSFIHREEFRKKRETDSRHVPIRIAFWGLLRHTKLNRAVVDRIGGDKRFELYYYGRAQGAMLDLMKEMTAKYNNVFYLGEYDYNKREQFAINVDLLHNLYLNDTKTEPFAMGNKYYDGIGYYIPQLCTKGSYMGEMCVKHGVGIAIDPFSEDICEKIYSYYMDYDQSAFLSNCDIEYHRIANEVSNGIEQIKNALDTTNDVKKDKSERP